MRSQFAVRLASFSFHVNNEPRLDRSFWGWQVAIGGRNKYLINGHVAQQNRVQNLFHSVQLNINNPHFLIMQGRITKVPCSSFSFSAALRSPRCSREPPPSSTSQSGGPSLELEHEHAKEGFSIARHKEKRLTVNVARPRR